MQLASATDYMLEFTATITSDRTDTAVELRYSLPSCSHGIEIDRPHSAAEVLAELAFAAANDHDYEQDALIRLVGLHDAVRVVNASLPDIL